MTSSNEDKAYGKVHIYALKDPDTGRVFYVGRTKRTPKTRFLAHMAEAERYERDTESVGKRLWGIDDDSPTKDSKEHSNVRKLRWILSIKNRGLEVELEVLDEAEFEIEQDAARLEEAWIAEMRQRNQPLTNYIYSRRMSPSWYGETNPRYKEGWAKTPLEYIERLKKGEVGGFKTKTKKPRKRYSRTQLRRLSKKAHKASKKSKRSSKKKRRR